MRSRDSHAVALVTRIPVITADALVLLSTWLKTFRQIREARRLRMRVSIAECLLRDGKLRERSSANPGPNSSSQVPSTLRKSSVEKPPNDKF